MKIELFNSDALEGSLVSKIIGSTSDAPPVLGFISFVFNQQTSLGAAYNSVI